VFDKDRSGFVGKGQIKYILTNLGEKMSEEEVDELFKSTIDASNDEVDYRGKLPRSTPTMSRNRALMQNRVRQDDCRELETGGQWMRYVYYEGFVFMVSACGYWRWDTPRAQVFFCIIVQGRRGELCSGAATAASMTSDSRKTNYLLDFTPDLQKAG
jgi:hypothetical protein